MLPNRYPFCRRGIYLLFITLLLFSLQSCFRKPENKVNAELEKQPSETVYAKEFGFHRQDGYIRLWIGQTNETLTEYFLIPAEKPIPAQLKGQPNIIATPVQSVVFTSTTQVPWLELLGSSQILSGFPDPDYLYSEVQRKRYERGQLKDIGGPSGMESEALVALKPDVVFSYSGRSEDQLGVILKKINSIQIQTREHLEAHPLGRAEWIRFMGILLNKQLLADSVFKSVAAAYQTQANAMIKVNDRPTVLTGIPYSGIWYMPGGGSYAAILFSDAGYDYPWSNEVSQAVIPLSFEKVFPVGLKADLWIGASNHRTLDQLLASEKRFADFRSVSRGDVWVYDQRSLPTGGNDYFESAGVRPDLVLRDLVHIRAGKTDSLYYYRKLK